MKPEAASQRGTSTHVVLAVEPSPERPLLLKFEMNDDGCQSPGYTLARAILAVYPAALLEIVLLDLLATVALSDDYEESTKYIDEADSQGIDLLRARLVRLAGYWERNRERFIEANKARRESL